MTFPAMLLLAAAISGHGCPVEALTVLPEFTGHWRVLRISGLDRPHPDSAMATATFSPDLQGCLTRELLQSEASTHVWVAEVLWGVNGADGAVQRIFAHSQHGRFGIYEGQRTGNSIALRQLQTAGQPADQVVENQVLIADRDHFDLVSRLSSDGGRSWQLLSRWEYRRG